MKLEHTGVTHKDMDFQNLAEATRDRILAGFRVSKTILGTAESDRNRATAKTADYVFSKRTIKPKIELILGAIKLCCNHRVWLEGEVGLAAKHLFQHW